MENEVYFYRTEHMNNLKSALIYKPYTILAQNLFDFVTSRIPPKPYAIKTWKSYYVLLNGIQYYDRSEPDRYGVWDEVEVILSQDETTDFTKLIAMVKVFDDDTPKLEHAIRCIIRASDTHLELLNNLPNCVHKYLTGINVNHNIRIPESRDTPDVLLIKQRVVQLMVLFPNI